MSALFGCIGMASKAGGTVPFSTSPRLDMNINGVKSEGNISSETNQLQRHVADSVPRRSGRWQRSRHLAAWRGSRLATVVRFVLALRRSLIVMSYTGNGTCVFETDYLHLLSWRGVIRRLCWLAARESGGNRGRYQDLKASFIEEVHNL